MSEREELIERLRPNGDPINAAEALRLEAAGALSAAQAEIARLNADEEQIAKLETEETLSGYCAMFSKLLEQGRSPEGANAYVVARATFDYTTKISVMEAEIARLREALKPFAKAGELFGDTHPGLDSMTIYAPSAGEDYWLESDDLRRARSALSGQTGERA